MKAIRIKILVGEEGCWVLFHWLSWKSQQAAPERTCWPGQKAFQIQKLIIGNERLEITTLFRDIGRVIEFSTGDS